MKSVCKNKSGLSGVVSAMIMIALVMAAGILIWVFSNKIVNKNLEEAESCFGIYDKVSINNDYTCYYSQYKEVWISIKVGDINLDGILVGVSGEGSSNSFTLGKQEMAIPNVKYYQGTDGQSVSAPEKNSGKTYVLKFYEKPEVIEIAPIVNEKQCDVSDSVYNVYNCD